MKNHEIKEREKTLQKILEQHVNKETLIDKEIVTDLVELGKLLEVKVPTMDKGNYLRFNQSGKIEHHY